MGVPDAATELKGGDKGECSVSLRVFSPTITSRRCLKMTKNTKRNKLQLVKAWCQIYVRKETLGRESGPVWDPKEERECLKIKEEEE